MLPGLFLVPAIASAILGATFLLDQEARPAWKLLVATLFLVALYLQLFSRHSLAGLLLQCTLAFGLVLRYKLGARA